MRTSLSDCGRCSESARFARICTLTGEFGIGGRPSGDRSGERRSNGLPSGVRSGDPGTDGFLTGERSGELGESPRARTMRGDCGDWIASSDDDGLPVRVYERCVVGVTAFRVRSASDPFLRNSESRNGLLNERFNFCPFGVRGMFVCADGGFSSVVRRVACSDSISTSREALLEVQCSLGDSTERVSCGPCM